MTGAGDRRQQCRRAQARAATADARAEAGIGGWGGEDRAQKLLRAMYLQASSSICSERLLMERLEYDLLFRWFV